MAVDVGSPDASGLDQSGGMGGMDANPGFRDGGADMGSGDMTVGEDGIKVEDLGPSACTSNAGCTDPQICLISPQTGERSCGDPVGPKVPGEQCVMSAECRSGLCLGGECVSPCDDKSSCPGGFECEASMVPLPGGMSATVMVCVEGEKACLADTDCAAPKVCVIDRAGGLKLVCEAPLPGTKDLGEACGTDNECRSGLCLDNVCARPCKRPNDCSMDGSFICEPTLISASGQDRMLNLCKPKPATQCLSDSQCNAPERCVATRGTREIGFACGGARVGGALGAACNADTECAENLCLNNICTIACQGNGDCTGAPDHSCENQEVNLGGANKDNVQVCTPPVVCQNKNACKVSEVCVVRAKNGVVDSICREPNTNGGTLGQVCTGDIACASNLCLTGRFDKVCSVPCVSNLDCGVAGYECRTTEVKPGLNARICAPKAPSVCMSNDDCATGLTCAVVPNQANTMLESVCIPNTGKGATGLACTTDAVCASRVCLGGACAAPCRLITDCGQNQVCRQNSVVKGALSGTFEVCEKLGDQVCDATTDCTDGVRVCGELRQTMAMQFETYCRFPVAGGGDLGDACTSNGTCRQGVCLSALLSSLADECSVFCGVDTDCSTTANQICTSLIRGINVCQRGCTDNGSCPTGEVCTLNSDFPQNDVDQVCQPPAANSKGLGETCAGSSECDNSLCVDTIQFGTTSCTMQADCAATEQCRCPVGQPGCSTGKRCSAVQSRCSRICNGNEDCVGNAANMLTACSTNVTVTLPDGVSTKTFSACGSP